MKIPNLKELAHKVLPYLMCALALLVFIILLMPEAKSEKEQKIYTLRQEMAEQDISLLKLTDEYKKHATLVEEEQKKLTGIQTTADDVRTQQNAKDQRIFNITKGQPEDQFLPKEEVKK